MSALAAPLAMRAFSYHWLLYRRTWRSTFVIGFLNPLLFLTGIGIGIGKLIDSDATGVLGGVPYLSFLAPGVLAASAMQMAFTGAFATFFAATPTGSYTSAAATELGPTDVLLGHQLFITFRVLLLSAAFVLVQVLLGAAESPLVALTILTAALTGTAFSAAGAAIGISVKRFKTVQSVFRFCIQPLYLLSGTFFALETVPGWLQRAAYASPLWHGVELSRALSLGTVTGRQVLVHGGFLLIATAVGFVLARSAYERRLRQ